MDTDGILFCRCGERILNKMSEVRIPDVLNLWIGIVQTKWTWMMEENKRRKEEQGKASARK